MKHSIRIAARPTALLAFAAAALASAACSTTPALTLTATPDSIGGDGQSPITVTAKVTSGGAPAADGTTVHFVSTDGIFSVDGTPSANPLVVDVESTGGVASAVLTAPRRGRGNIQITASSSFGGASVSAQATVALTPAGGLASSLQFSCATQNVGGFVSELANPIHVICTAKALDENGSEIPNASIEPYAEAGELAWITDPNSTNGEQVLVYTINPGAKPPVDVDPFGPDGNPRPVCPAACIQDPDTCDAEPCWVSQDGSTTHNPRDGVATLMVAVPGTPGFFDANSNGEPFVDAYDTGVYTAGEFYIDVNGNGKYDDSSGGQMQNTRMLWRAFRIIWSGTADISTSPHASSIIGQVGGSTLNNLTVRLNDLNYNKLAADSQGGGDSFSLTSTCSPDGSLAGNAFSQPIPLDSSNPGILFDSATGDISGRGSPSSYRQETDTNLQTNYGATQITGNSGASTCTITATVSRTYDPGAGTLFPSDGQSSGETVTGSASFAAPVDGGS